jgi:uncharacterized MAPEG superfamily protein
MPAGLIVLELSIVLGFVHIILASHAASLQRGYRWTASARDEAVPPLAGIAGRLDRASRNFAETFPLFATASIAAYLTGATGTLALWGAFLYLGGRIVYLLLYVAGVFLLRSLVWNVATLGIFLILAASW